jgi:hypothetical protein
MTSSLRVKQVHSVDTILFHFQFIFIVDRDLDHKDHDFEHMPAGEPGEFKHYSD